MFCALLFACVFTQNPANVEGFLIECQKYFQIPFLSPIIGVILDLLQHNFFNSSCQQELTIIYIHNLLL